MSAELEMIQKHMDDRFNRLEKMLADVAAQSTENNTELARYEERLKMGAENFARNSEQHKDFYGKIDGMEKRADKIDGGLLVIKILIVPLIIAVIAAIVRTII
jgi:hypothetical protein